MYLKTLLFVSISLLNTIYAVYSPIIFVPGDGGSQLYANLNKTTTTYFYCKKISSDYNLWLNLELLMPLSIDCLVENMRLQYDNVSRKTRNTDGVNIWIQDFGDPNVVEFLDPTKWRFTKYFSSIGNMLREQGYKNKINLHGAPYDFRKGPNELQNFFQDLKTLIENTSINNGHQRVTLIAHSLGSLLTLHLLQNMPQTWKDKYIRLFVPISGPWGGAVKAVKVFCIGDNFNLYTPSQSTLKLIQVTFPSSAWLLPTKQFWSNNDIFVSRPSKNYTLNNYQELFNDLDYKIGWDMFTDLKPFELTNKAPGVEVYCFYSLTKNNSTVERLVYKTDNIIGEKNPGLIFGLGDDTVNLRSLQGCTKWKQAQNQRVRIKIYDNVDHLAILTDNRLINDLKQLLNEI